MMHLPPSLPHPNSDTAKALELSFIALGSNGLEPLSIIALGHDDAATAHRTAAASSCPILRWMHEEHARVHDDSARKARQLATTCTERGR